MVTAPPRVCKSCVKRRQRLAIGGHAADLTTGSFEAIRLASGEVADVPTVETGLRDREKRQRGFMYHFAG